MVFFVFSGVSMNDSYYFLKEEMFMNENKIQLFENQKIRTAWDEEREEWYFSIVAGIIEPL